MQIQILVRSIFFMQLSIWFHLWCLLMAGAHLHLHACEWRCQNSEGGTWMVTIAMLKNRLELRVNVEVIKINEGETNNQMKRIIWTYMHGCDIDNIKWTTNDNKTHIVEWSEIGDEKTVGSRLMTLMLLGNTMIGTDIRQDLANQDGAVSIMTHNEALESQSAEEMKMICTTRT